MGREGAAGCVALLATIGTLASVALLSPLFVAILDRSFGTAEPADCTVDLKAFA